MPRIVIPDKLAAYHAEYTGDDGGPGWLAGLPGLAEEYLERWDLRPDGDAHHGMVALVLPVRRADGTPAALKLQPVNDENDGEPTALRVWDGDGAVRLLDSAPETGTMLLERLDGHRTLQTVPDDEAALLTLSQLLARLVATPAPPGMRTLADIAGAMLKEAPDVRRKLGDDDERRLLETCAAAVAEVIGEPGDRMLHWDLHYENVLAPLPGSGREPWLAIDPKPLAGDPGFDLLPAIGNRWEDITATGDVPRTVRRRFDLMTEVLGLDRGRAARWTLGRVLQNSLWDVEDEADGEGEMTEEQFAVGEALLPYLA
ncbi:aminoglycoside phosphotransferase family protein [Streptomyces sp. B1866]|uniref:aminoglycoside phosphotransferase family protein n=1 Tax=Streptomyces sp. B1866 TaxID=3075431 RepID=UPI0028917E48|nr:aminoglycoside phosphotransferase family protein [Streptomyces sp. B1866]MDT3398843.1 aminoglycoside phosphotransferase family protein [Streptomyces sp. B1866]